MVGGSFVNVIPSQVLVPKPGIGSARDPEL